MKKNEDIRYELSKGNIIFLLVYYSLYIIVGIAISIIELCFDKNILDMKMLIIHMVISSFGVSGMLCSVQYIRRLYKACITERIKSEISEIGKIGTMVYFIFRPIFTFCFVIIIIVGLVSGMYVVTGSLDYVLNEKLIYVCMIMSAYIGYSIGNLIDRFESISEKQIETLNM